MNTSSAETIRTTGNNRALSSSRPVVVPANRKLSATVTYSDLPGGYRTVARELQVLPAPSGVHGGSTVSPSALTFSAKGWMEVVDDPESIAMLVVSRNPGERAYSAEISIPHQKLRHLFGDAVRWYLMAREKWDDDVFTVYVENDTLDFEKSTLPSGITFFNVHADGRVFREPSVRRFSPPTIINVSTISIGIVFAVICVLLHGTMADFYYIFGVLHGKSVAVLGLFAQLIRPYVSAALLLIIRLGIVYDKFVAYVQALVLRSLYL